MNLSTPNNSTMYCPISESSSLDHGIHHPYFPHGADIPNYVANSLSVLVLLRGFACLIVVYIASGLFLAKKINPGLFAQDLVALAWFLLCFFLHAFFEGYFVLYNSTLAGSQSLFAQLWKEYALSDSRYMTSDPFMLCIESLTVLLWAPLCFAIILSIVINTKTRHPLQIIMCVGHLFGIALYYGTCFFEYRYRGVSHSRPEFLYYWIYYVGFNLPWVVVPAVLLCNSIQEVLFVLDQLDLPLSVTQSIHKQIHEHERKLQEFEHKWDHKMRYTSLVVECLDSEEMKEQKKKESDVLHRLVEGLTRYGYTQQAKKIAQKLERITRMIHQMKDRELTETDSDWTVEKEDAMLISIECEKEAKELVQLLEKIRQLGSELSELVEAGKALNDCITKKLELEGNLNVR